LSGVEPIRFRDGVSHATSIELAWAPGVSTALAFADGLGRDAGFGVEHFSDFSFFRFGQGSESVQIALKRSLILVHFTLLNIWPAPCQVSR
jgi:hypothetical protein